MKLYLLTLWMFMNPNWSSLNAVLFLWRCFYFCSEATDFHIQHAKLPHPKPPAAPLCLPERRKINPHISAVLLPGRLCGPITQAPAVSFWPGENSTQPGLHGWMEGLGGGVLMCQDEEMWCHSQELSALLHGGPLHPRPTWPKTRMGNRSATCRGKTRKFWNAKEWWKRFLFVKFFH